MILVLDNGSKRPESTRNLRRIAHAMTRRLAQTVHAVSLQHSSDIPPEALDGSPAETLEPFLRRQLRIGERDFVIVPLFFGPSRAVDAFVPEMRERLAAQFGPFDLRVARVLCPLPPGEPRLVSILEHQVREATSAHGEQPRHLVLVDHGSPVPAVTAVREWLASELARRFAGEAEVDQAVMERRAGRRYDFNGELLEDVLDARGAAGTPTNVVLAMQFISPGRHAGAGGDVDDICLRAMARWPGLRVLKSRLISEHPLFEEILYDRAAETAG